jgi:tetratricopeptide (TPR) repeat protein
MAEAFMGLGKLEEAVAILEGAVESSPTSVECWYRLGQAYFRSNAYEKAAMAYQQAVRIDPGFTRAYYGLATVHSRMRREQEAEKYRDQFRRLKRKDLDTLSAQERAYDDRAASRQNVVNTYVLAGQVYLAHEATQQAEEHWKKAAALGPADVDSRRHLLELYEKENRPEQALGVLEDLIEIQPNAMSHYLNLGTLNMRLGRFDAAEKAYRKCQEVAKDRPEGYVGLANLYLGNGRNFAEARELAETAVRLQPIASNYFLLGAAHKHNNDLDRARKAVKRAMELDPENPLYPQRYAELEKKE